jgi:predicted phosphodiesterase
MARSSNTVKTDTAREYRRKHGPDMPTLKLARIMYAENSLLFKDLEDARGKLRYIEGKRGDYSRRKLGKEGGEFVIKEDRSKNPYGLPASDETQYEPYVIKGHKRVAIFSDVHVPYHSISALTIAIDFVKKEKPDALILNGDTIDCHKLSRFVTDPGKRDFKLELDTFKAFFAILQRELNCQIYFKEGNHEERYERFLLEKASELKGIEEFEFTNILKARANGIVHIGEKRIMKLNGLNGIHGHEYPGGISAPVNMARGLYMRGKTSAFQGPNHTSSSHNETDMNGKLTNTWSIGCLCELHPRYLPLNKWNHGFAVVDLDDNGEDFDFRNYKIYQGKVRPA